MSSERYQAEVLRACADVVASPNFATEIRDLFGLWDFGAAEHTEVFVLELIPDASIYLTTAAHLAGVPLELVEGFYSALGLDGSGDASSLSSQLGFFASLLEMVADNRSDAKKLAVLDRTRSAFLFEHIVPWVPVYASVVARIAPELGPWSSALLEVLESQFAQLDLKSWDWDAAVLDSRPAFSTYEESTLSEMLVSPFLSGFVLTRKLLFSRSHQLGLAPRVGTRKFMMASLLDQDPRAAITLVGAEAIEQSGRWRDLGNCFGSALVSWEKQCQDSLDALGIPNRP